MQKETEMLLEVMPTPKIREREERKYYSNKNELQKLIGEGFQPIDSFSDFGYAYKTIRTII